MNRIVFWAKAQRVYVLAIVLLAMAAYLLWVQRVPGATILPPPVDPEGEATLKALPVEILPQPGGKPPAVSVLLQSADPIYLWQHGDNVAYLANDCVGVIGDGWDPEAPFCSAEGILVQSVDGHVLTAREGIYVLTERGPIAISVSDSAQTIRYAWAHDNLYYTLSCTESGVNSFLGLFVFDSGTGESRRLMDAEIGYSVQGMALSPEGGSLVMFMKYSLSEYGHEYYQEVWLYDLVGKGLRRIDGLHLFPDDEEEKLIMHTTPHWISPQYIVVELASRLYGCFAGAVIYRYGEDGLSVQRVFRENSTCGGLKLAGIDAARKTIFFRKVLPFACGPWDGPYYMLKYVLVDDSLAQTGIPSGYYPSTSTFDPVSQKHFVVSYHNVLGVADVPNDGLVEVSAIMNGDDTFVPLFAAQFRVLEALWHEGDLLVVVNDSLNGGYSLQKICWQN